VRRVSREEATRVLEALKANPPIRQEGNTIEIGEIEDQDLGRNVSISYVILTPPQTKFTGMTGSGDETVAGIAGPVEMRTGSGDLSLHDIGHGAPGTSAWSTSTVMWMFAPAAARYRAPKSPVRFWPRAALVT
jgi:hypothetical protein